MVLGTTFMWVVGSPKGGTIGEYREDDAVEDSSPVEKIEASDGIAEDVKGFAGGACSVTHGLDVGSPG